MIDLLDIRYVRLATRNVEEATCYAQKILGLDLVRTEDGARYFRSDNRRHPLVYYEGDPIQHVTGFELARAEELEAAAAALANAGYRVESSSQQACEQRHVHSFVNF